MAERIEMATRTEFDAPVAVGALVLGGVTWLVLWSLIAPSSAIEVAMVIAMLVSVARPWLAAVDTRIATIVRSASGAAVLVGGVHWLSAGIVWWLGLGVIAAGAAVAAAPLIWSD